MNKWQTIEVKPSNSKSEKGTSLLSYFLRVFLLTIVVPIFLINFFLNQKYKEVLVNNYSEKVMQVMEQMTVSYEDDQKRMALVVSQLANDSELLGVYAKWYQAQSKSDTLDYSKEIDSKIKYMLKHDTSVETLTVFFKDGTYYYNGNPPVSKFSEISENSWYKTMQNNKGTVVRIGLTDGITYSVKDVNRIAVAIKPTTPKGVIEAIYYEADTNAFSTIYSDYAKQSLGNLLFMDKSGKILISSHKDYEVKNTETINEIKKIVAKQQTVIVRKVSETGQYISAYYMKKSGGMMVNIVSEDMLTKDINGVLRIFNWVYVIVIILFIVFTMSLFQKMIAPLRKLIKKMKSVHKDNLGDVVEVHGPTEIRQLNESYNVMIADLKKLMMERDLKEYERSKEEMRALQAQINPHFVYNTLNSIRLMAMMSKAEGIKNMIDAFMKILSKTFKDVGKRVLIEEEIDYLQNYIFIMQVRYGDGFKFQVDMEEAVKSYYILNMLLQPIIENAILHGFKDQQSDNMILIHGFMEADDVIIDVIDNGCGMSPEEIQKVLTQNQYSKGGLNHMGVANVDKRIKLNFGKRYGLEIDSQLGVSTKVRLRLPKLEAEERGHEDV